MGVAREAVAEHIPPGAIRVLTSDFLRLFFRNVDVSVASNIRFNCRMIADDGGTVDFQINAGNASTTTWAETAFTSSSHIVPANGWIVSIAATSTDGGFLAIPGQVWFKIEFMRSDGGNIPATFAVIAKHNHGSKWWTWNAGDQAESPFYEGPGAGIGTPAKTFTFQGTVVNGAGGAGNNSLTIVPPSGGRFRVLAFQATNNDTSARTADILIQDTSTGNDLVAYITGLSLSAGQSANLPVTNAQASNAPASGLQNVWIAGGNEFFAVIAAVAASQDTAWACILEVFGGAPTLTLAGASTPTLTTNISRFETG